MTARYRSADDRAIHTGTYFNGTIPPGSTVSRNDNCGQERECTDVVGNFPNVNPFDCHSRWTIRARMSGEQYNAAGTTLLRKLEAYPVDRVATARDPRSYLGTLDVPGIQQLLRQALNQSSPNQAHVSLPTAIGELKDFGYVTNIPADLRKLGSAPFTEQLRNVPSLIRRFGDNLLKNAANGYISWRWAVKPMVSDVRKMIQFIHAVEKRRNYLERLMNGETVRRKVYLSSRQPVVTQPEVFATTGQGFSGKFTWNIEYSERVWATARWKLSTSAVPLPKADDALLKRAYRLTFGLTAFELLKTAWELTPWSWFADWFGDIGANLALYNNTVPAYWGNLALMRTISSKSNYALKPGTFPSWVIVTMLPVEEWTIKERYNDTSLWLPLLPATAPLMDSGKWSILSALYCAKVGRWVSLSGPLTGR